MAISRERKEELVALYGELLADTNGMIVTEYRGMTMPAFNEIRKSLREIGASYLVTKNRLFKIALEQAGLPVDEELLSGPVAIGFAHQDMPKMVKIMLDKRKEQELLVLKGAILGNNVFGEQDLDALSKLPTLDELRAQLLGMLTQPMQGVVNVIAAPPQELVGVIQAGTQTIVNVLAAYAASEDAA